MPPTLRTASVADIAAIHCLIEGGYRGESAKRGWTHEADLLGGQRTDPAALAEIIAGPAQTMLLAMIDGALAGCVQIADRGEGVFYLGMLTVDPARQSAGLGRALIEAAEQHARASGASVMEMSVISQRTDLIAWYQRRGYALTGREKPFPLDDPRFGLPKTRDLKFVILAKRLL
jgi:ribosomal protein S18 acetylase RimI-like enzyme